MMLLFFISYRPPTGDLLLGRSHRLSQMHPSPHGISVTLEADCNNGMEVLKGFFSTWSLIFYIRGYHSGMTED